MEQYIVAIDPGTSKIVAMIARKEAGGKISILRTEEVDSENAIRRGCIYNVDAAAEKMAFLIHRLNEDYAKPKLHAPIESLYVSIGGQSLHTERYSICKQVDNGMIDQPLLNSIKEEIDQYKPELYEVLEVLPPEYYVDGQLTLNPRGTTATSIEARYQLIVVSNPNLKTLIRRSIPDKIEIEGYIVAPLATAAAVLEKKEKELGCALVEFGAGVTTVSIYKSGILRYLVTIPLGSLVITKDIRCLNVSEEEAENLKKNYGSAIADWEDMRKITIDEGLSTSREVEVRNLNMIIEARVDEILENVIHQIQESGYADSLVSGIVITGGGTGLRHLEESFRNKMNGNLRVAYPTATGTNQPAEYSTIIGLLTLAKKESVYPEKGNTSLFPNDEIEKEPAKKPGSSKPAEPIPGKHEPKRRPSFMDRFRKGIDTISGEIFTAADYEPGNENKEQKNN
ncbi:MAG: cell division protein FtsA [Dysgonamonadaceae bacterium]|nr:cell division protein FtsA [Dysgonamonadaceae bacterium]